MSAQIEEHADLPVNIDAERAVLGSVLIENRAFFRVSPTLTVDDFFRDAHKALWRALSADILAGVPVDPLTIRSDARRCEQSGGVAYLASLLDSIPDIANVERYAEIVARESHRRQIIKAADKARRSAMDPMNDPEDVAAELFSDVTGLSTREEAQARPLHEVIHETYEALERRMNGEAVGALTSGFPELDRYRAIRRTFVVIGSPSNHGKTGLAVNLARGLAENGHGVAFFSLESTDEETSLRYVSTVGQIAHSRVQDWKYLFPGDHEKLAHAELTAKKQAIWLTRRIRSIEEIHAECRRLKALHGLDAILVDYIQLVTGPAGRRFEREDLRMAAISQTFLEMAIDLQIAVIATSQLNEERTKRDSGRLHQGDLKNARAIGETARVVLLFQRPYADEKGGPALPCEVRFQIEKNNENLTNDYQWHFDESRQTFREGGCAENGCKRAQNVEPNFW